LGDVQGCAVLDIACGTGSTSKWLIDHRAIVIALNVSPTKVQLTKEKLCSAGIVLPADLNKPMDFTADHFIDKVLCALALDYIKD
jgi:2-polyprenyl-6-hydroxyphenyl methylase/3-demethylubiquinone-9 3-methyltransferase